MISKFNVLGFPVIHSTLRMKRRNCGNAQYAGTYASDRETIMAAELGPAQFKVFIGRVPDEDGFVKFHTLRVPKYEIVGVATLGISVEEAKRFFDCAFTLANRIGRSPSGPEIEEWVKDGSLDNFFRQLKESGEDLLVRFAVLQNDLEPILEGRDEVVEIKVSSFSRWHEQGIIPELSISDPGIVSVLDRVLNRIPDEHLDNFPPFSIYEARTPGGGITLSEEALYLDSMQCGAFSLENKVGTVALMLAILYTGHGPDADWGELEDAVEIARTWGFGQEIESLDLDSWVAD